MAWHIHGDGQGIDEDTLRTAFSEFVRTVDAKSTNPDHLFHGRIWGSSWVGDDEEGREGFVLTSDEVRAA